MMTRRRAAELYRRARNRRLFEALRLQRQRKRQSLKTGVV